MKKDDANHVTNADAADLFGLNGQGREDLKRRFFEGRASLRAVARFYKVPLKDAEEIVGVWRQEREEKAHDEWRKRQ